MASISENTKNGCNSGKMQILYIAHHYSKTMFMLEDWIGGVLVLEARLQRNPMIKTNHKETKQRKLICKCQGLSDAPA